MRTSEIASRWLEYFGRNGHHIAPSVPLVSPDPSVLFTIAGMVPFVDYILGTEPAPWPRVASVQKCIRTNDIDEVGRTTRHGTFFQMCGNFSFGDYFKEGAINYAHELLTSPLSEGGYALDADKLWYTIWENDDDSAGYLRDLGVAPERIQPLPMADIFWDTGQPGPAGPCCEIHYDRGPDFGPEGGPAVDLKGDRFLEIWNLVFDQYIRGEGVGKNYPLLGELEFQSIDTGLGLERLAFLLQGKDNMYEIDEVFPVIARASEMSGRDYGRSSGDDVQMRVVADHVRSALMLIGDGVRPGNDGRGYVLRRLIRRAVRSMRLLGVDEPVFPELLPASMNVMKGTYPELGAHFEAISEVAYNEEDAFRRTLTAGTTILDTAISLARRGSRAVTGAEAFALHDTYGFPIDLTLEIAAEQGVTVDADAFRTLMTEQRERARADALARKKGHVDASTFNEIRARLGGDTLFAGYTDDTTRSRVVAILLDGVPVPAATAPADVDVVLDTTPFYAEAGGQLGDRGTLSFSSGAVVDVLDTQAPVKGVTVHRGTLNEGTLVLGDAGVARIDTARRNAIAQAHTATHMVHQVLLDRLGSGATQAGSENSPSRMRFDFQHGSALPSALVDEMEGEVNLRLAENLSVSDSQMPIDEAKALGAQAIFGEKYGNIVRVVDIGEGWSRELCGGTHVPLTGNIGRVSVLGESSIGSGVRRIEALVGSGAYAHEAKEGAILSQLSHIVGAQPDEIANRISQLMGRLKAAEKELATIRSQAVLARAAELAGRAVRGAKALGVVESIGAVSSADDIRALAIDVRDRLGADATVALIGLVSGKPMIVVATNGGARSAGVKAGALVRVAAGVLKGGGGGRDDIAQGGGTDAASIPAALDSLKAAL